MNRKARLLTVIALVIAGIAVMAYPSLSSYINANRSSRAIQSLSARLDAAGSETLREQRRLAEEYNRTLSEGTAAPEAEYDHILDFGNGVMGFIRIPEIGVELPIYHGVSDTVLQKGAGHMPSSALPIGGAGNHCILTGHTGLPSAKLFTDLTELAVGDQFELHVLDEVLVYGVDQITVVLPHEVDSLSAVPGRDYCTLVTCTPYGINSHRLLVRGERVSARQETAIRQEREAPGDHTPLPPELLLAGTVLLLLLGAGALVLLRKETEGCQ